LDMDELVHIAAGHVELLVVVSALVWLVIRLTVEALLRRSSNPLVQQSISMYGDHVVAFVDAFYLIGIASTTLYKDPSLWENPVYGVSDYAIFACYTFGGYCFYDTCMMFWNGVRDPTLYLHHAIGLFAVVLQYTTGMHITIGIVAMALMEATNPSMNIMLSMRSLKMEGHIIYIINGMCFVLLYFFFRIIGCGYVSYHFLKVYYESGLLFTLHASGAFVFVSLTVLSFLWFGKILALAKRTGDRYMAQKKKGQ